MTQPATRAAITVDDSQFQAALREYVAETSKTAQEALNGKMRDVCWRSAAETDKATAKAVRAIKLEPWWPKYIAKLTTIAFGKGTLNRDQFKEAARKISKQVINKRVRGVAFLRSGYVKAGNQFKRTDASKQSKPRGGARVSNAPVKTSTRQATKQRLNASTQISWQAKDRAGDAAGKEKVLDRGLQRGVDYVFKDMVKYLERKNIFAAKRVSSTRVA